MWQRHWAVITCKIKKYCTYFATKNSRTRSRWKWTVWLHVKEKCCINVLLYINDGLFFFKFFARFVQRFYFTFNHGLSITPSVTTSWWSTSLSNKFAARQQQQQLYHSFLSVKGHVLQHNIRSTRLQYATLHRRQSRTLLLCGKTKGLISAFSAVHF